MELAPNDGDDGGDLNVGMFERAPTYTFFFFSFLLRIRPHESAGRPNN